MAANKVVLVTGGGSGIGRAAAVLFASKSCGVCVADVDEAGAKETCSLITSANGDAKPIRCDVSKEDDVKQMVDFVRDQFGRLDYAFNNAGVMDRDPASFTHETSMEEFDRVMSINTRGAFMCLKHEVPLMLATSESPAVVFTTSAAGHQDIPLMGVYGMSKWALRGLVATAAKEYGPLGLRVNSVSPGGIDTPIGNSRNWEVFMGKLMAGPQLESKAAADKEKVPLGLPTIFSPQSIALGRHGKPEEVASLVAWLCMEGTYVTGQSLPLDGGVLCHP